MRKLKLFKAIVVASFLCLFSENVYGGGDVYNNRLENFPQKRKAEDFVTTHNAPQHASDLPPAYEEVVGPKGSKGSDDVSVVPDTFFGGPREAVEPVFSPSSSMPASVEPHGRDVSDLFAGGGSEGPAAAAFAMPAETIAFVNEQVQKMEQRLLERIEELAGVVDEKYDEVYGELSGRINGLEVRIGELVDKLYSTEVAIAQQLRHIESSSEVARATAERAMGAVMRLQAAQTGEKPASTQHYPPPLLSEMSEERGVLTDDSRKTTPSVEKLHELDKREKERQAGEERVKLRRRIDEAQAYKAQKEHDRDEGDDDEDTDEDTVDDEESIGTSLARQTEEALETIRGSSATS